MNWLCKILGHNFIIVRWGKYGDYSKYAQRLFCCRCGKPVWGRLLDNNWEGRYADQTLAGKTE